jgi:hypothetical protein
MDRPILRKSNRLFPVLLYSRNESLGGVFKEAISTCCASCPTVSIFIGKRESAKPTPYTGRFLYDCAQFRAGSSPKG